MIVLHECVWPLEAEPPAPPIPAVPPPAEPFIP